MFMEDPMRTFRRSFSGSQLFGDERFCGGPLPKGKPAGVKKAQEIGGNALLIIVGTGLAGLGIGLAASAGNSGGPTSSSNTVTGTQP